VSVYGNVHPEHRGRSVGCCLVHPSEAWTRAVGGGRTRSIRPEGPEKETLVGVLQYGEGIFCAAAEVPGYGLQVVLRHVHVAEAAREL
jgi:hypothetical protein